MLSEIYARVREAGKSPFFEYRERTNLGFKKNNYQRNKPFRVDGDS